MSDSAGGRVLNQDVGDAVLFNCKGYTIGLDVTRLCKISVRLKSNEKLCPTVHPLMTPAKLACGSAQTNFVVSVQCRPDLVWTGR